MLLDETEVVMPEITPREETQEATQETEDAVQGEEETQQGEEETQQEQEEAAQDEDGARRAQELAELRAELASEKARRAQLAAEERRLVERLSPLGYGGSAQEIADHLEAQDTGKDVTLIRAEREARQKLSGELEQRDRQLEALLERDARRRMTDDLAKIRRIDTRVQSLDELGEPYAKLIRAGVDAVTAYGVIAAGKPKPKAPDAADRAHMIPTGGNAGSADRKEIPAAELEFYRDSFPKDTAAQLKERYNRILKRQE